jgi:hypothetical protein
MNRQFPKILFRLICCAAAFGGVPAASALPYGAHDARALAMGGSGVAAVENPNPAYFNPALLAAYTERKHLGGNQRIVFPSFSGSASREIGDLIDIENLDYEDRISSAISDFNRGLANEALSVFASLDSDLRTVSEHPIAVDLYTGLVISVPDHSEGGAFSFSRRFVLDGQVEYSGADTALVNAYQEELRAVAEGAAPGVLHPELYEGGELIDPVENLTSRASAVGLKIDQMAFSMAWKIQAFELPVMVGITPKLVRVTSYEYSADAASSRLTDQSTFDNGENFNLDLGYAQDLNDRWLVGVAVKDLISKDYKTASGRIVPLDPQLRVGTHYQSVWGAYNLDLDLTKNRALAGGDANQMLAFGVEWVLGGQHLRAGAHRNLAGNGENGEWAYSLGFRLRLFSVFVDFAWGEGANQQTAALQMGIRF